MNQEYRECEPQEEEEEDKKEEETPQPEEGEKEEETEKVEEENELANTEEKPDEKEEPEPTPLSTMGDLLVCLICSYNFVYSIFSVSCIMIFGFVGIE